jgi:hypothetical protein
MSKELNSSALEPKFRRGDRIFHAMTRQQVEIVSVLGGSQVVSYEVKTKRGKPFNAMEGELCYPPAPKERKSRDRDRD